MQGIKLGVDCFLRSGGTYRGRRLALVTNHASLTSGYDPTRVALLRTGYKLIQLFSPEHGVLSNGADGCEMKDQLDPLTGLPVISLYGARLKPDPHQLADIEALLFDLPDIGCRFYTYLWTLTYVMEACQESGKELLVLDRPNPISGDLELAEGPLLNETQCSSFIGRWSIPLRHSCTIGELATFWQQTRFPDLRLKVVPVEGWQRAFYHSDWATSFVPTSPAMVDAEAALLYPGLGLLEATNLSEGRSTATPFRIAGAPWIEALHLTRYCNDLDLPGVRFRAIDFTPGSGPYRQQQCHGVMAHVTDRKKFRPVYSALLTIRLVKDLYPKYFRWSRYVTHVNPSGEGHLDKLLGIPNSEELFRLSLGELRNKLSQLLDCSDWIRSIRPYLLY